ncbi:transforming growth factor-beta-induced protein ig-h3-like [Rhopilema esculentum]|uniref:transforming growth factor-beta-induced protein ig-h3-like n=1 Tax=Rhopilema esculentum TaxID=499914 RepID=UPI0031D32F69
MAKPTAAITYTSTQGEVATTRGPTLATESVIMRDYLGPPRTIFELLTENGLTVFASHISKYPALKKMLDSDAKGVTVFAPTNSAFDEMIVEEKEKIANGRNLLHLVLSHHIVGGNLQINGLRFKELTSFADYPLIIRSFERRLMIDKATIIEKDIVASNGHLNIIDNVIVPIDNTMFGVLRQLDRPKITIFLKLIESAGMNDVLENFTRARLMLWIPTDEAFQKLGSRTLKALFLQKEKLRQLLNYHMTPGYFSTKLMTTRWVYVFITRHNKSRLRARKFNDKPTGLMLFGSQNSQARSVKLNVVATNGLIHFIDSVLNPPNFSVFD